MRCAGSWIKGMGGNRGNKGAIQAVDIFALFPRPNPNSLAQDGELPAVGITLCLNIYKVEASRQVLNVKSVGRFVGTNGMLYNPTVEVENFNLLGHAYSPFVEAQQGIIIRQRRMQLKQVLVQVLITNIGRIATSIVRTIPETSVYRRIIHDRRKEPIIEIIGIATR